MNTKILFILLLFVTNSIMAKSITLTDQAERKVVLEEIPKEGAVNIETLVSLKPDLVLQLEKL